MPRWGLALLLLFLPAHADEVQEDCGLLPGETYRIDARYLLRPDGTVVENWKNCYLPEGVRLSAGIAEVGGPPNTVTVVRLVVTPPCVGTETWTRTEVPKAESFFRARGVSADAISVVLQACSATRPVIDAVVEQVEQVPPAAAP